MVHIESHRPHPSTVKDIDPALTLGEDIAKLVIDWTHINRIKRIDEIGVHLQGTVIAPSDLQQLLGSLLMDVTSKDSKITVEKHDVKHFCHEHHVTHSKKCHICGADSIRELPRIQVRLKAKDRKAEIHL
jgi:Zn finger protein HypA/HybF involved in hydrogenase expression